MYCKHNVIQHWKYGTMIFFIEAIRTYYWENIISFVHLFLFWTYSLKICFIAIRLHIRYSNLIQQKKRSLQMKVRVIHLWLIQYLYNRIELVAEFGKLIAACNVNIKEILRFKTVESKYASNFFVTNVNVKHFPRSDHII